MTVGAKDDAFKLRVKWPNIRFHEIVAFTIEADVQPSLITTIDFNIISDLDCIHTAWKRRSHNVSNTDDKINFQDALLVGDYFLDPYLPPFRADDGWTLICNLSSKLNFNFSPDIEVAICKKLWIGGIGPKFNLTLPRRGVCLAGKVVCPRRK